MRSRLRSRDFRGGIDAFYDWVDFLFGAHLRVLIGSIGLRPRTGTGPSPRWDLSGLFRYRPVGSVSTTVDRPAHLSAVGGFSVPTGPRGIAGPTGDPVPTTAGGRGPEASRPTTGLSVVVALILDAVVGPGTGVLDPTLLAGRIRRGVESDERIRRGVESTGPPPGTLRKAPKPESLGVLILQDFPDVRVLRTSGIEVVDMRDLIRGEIVPTVVAALVIFLLIAWFAEFLAKAVIYG